jgi:hypothetical protein
MSRINQILTLSLLAMVPVSVAAAPQFIDVTTDANITFVGTYGTTFPNLIFPNDMMQRNMGNGAAVGDYDGDGDLDVYLLAAMDLPNVLLRNDLDLGSKTFTDVTATAGVGDLGFSRVAHFADLDNDADLDLVLINDNTPIESHPVSKIYRNNADGTFTDVTAGSGFAPVGYMRCGASLADYDGDGLLDIYVTNWGLEAGVGQATYPGSNRLYRNLGGLTFEDVTDSVGLGGLERDSFTAIFHDFDGDDRPDIYVAVDHTSDEFYWNTPSGFVNDSVGVGVTHTGNDMGATCSDFDDDGDLDLYVANITDPDESYGYTQFNVLHVNQANTTGSVSFVDEAVARGIGDTYWGWGTEFFDADNDGDLDIVAANGYDEFVIFGDPNTQIYQTPTVLFVNDGTGIYTRATSSGVEYNDDSRALVAFDYDRDGDEDLLITNVNQPVRLLENVSDPSGHWLTVRLVQTAGGNRDGVGATVWATVGGVTKRRDVITGQSYLSGSPAEVHFGLGAFAVIDELRVDWTDGTESTYTNVPADREIEIVQFGPDGDLDGVDDGVDCAPGDGQLWSAPGAVADLMASGSVLTDFSWTDPSNPGATVPTYDLLRAVSPEMTSPDCLQTDATETVVTDGSIPAAAYYYLVRARSGCGENAGAGQGGMPRAPETCP